jgi:hypothetical protein
MPGPGATDGARVACTTGNGGAMVGLGGTGVGEVQATTINSVLIATVDMRKMRILFFIY